MSKACQDTQRAGREGKDRAPSATGRRYTGAQPAQCGKGLRHHGNAAHGREWTREDRTKTFAKGRRH
ncbi:hypothetical protein Sm713_75050 [Streptomyces sp. TS71-3]|nr:hypothetical protein Sm713_75050 [Streptomyces sp. TS71-3]